MRCNIFAVIFMALVSAPLTASATTPANPIFIGAQMVVVAVSVASEQPDVLRDIPELELQQEAARYISSRFKESGVAIQVADLSHFKDPPKGIFPKNVLMAFIRIDATRCDLGDGKERLLGSVHTWIRRDADAFLSNEPATFFWASNDASEVAARAKEAAISQVDRSVVKPIIALER